MVPDDVDTFGDFADLHERESREPTPLGREGVVLTEKLAATLNVEAGDTVTLEDADGNRADFLVTGVCENYVYNYVYMSGDAYAEGFSVYQGNQHLFREAHLDSLDLGGTWNVLLFQLYDTENSDFFYDSPASRYELVDGETGEVLIQDVFRAFCQQYDQVFGTQLEGSHFGEDSAGDVSDVEQATDEVSTASPLPR